MRKKILTPHDMRHSEDLFYPPIKLSETGTRQLYQEAHEYDFLSGKTPQVLPDEGEEEME